MTEDIKKIARELRRVIALQQYYTYPSLPPDEIRSFLELNARLAKFGPPRGFQPPSDAIRIATTRPNISTPFTAAQELLAQLDETSASPEEIEEVYRLASELGLNVTSAHKKVEQDPNPTEAESSAPKATSPELVMEPEAKPLQPKPEPTEPAEPEVAEQATPQPAPLTPKQTRIQNELRRRFPDTGGVPPDGKNRKKLIEELGANATDFYEAQRRLREGRSDSAKARRTP